MRNYDRIVASGKVPFEGISQAAIGEEFHYDRSIQYNHRESRISRTTCAALCLTRIGFACCMPSNHSRIVGRSATRSNSLLMKSERLMPSRAARAFKVL